MRIALATRSASCKRKKKYMPVSSAKRNDTMAIFENRRKVSIRAIVFGIIHCGMTAGSAGSIVTHVLVLLVLKGRFLAPSFVTQRPTVIKTEGDYLSDNDNLSAGCANGFIAAVPWPLDKAADTAPPQGRAGAALAALIRQTATTRADEPGSLDACLEAQSNPKGSEISGIIVDFAHDRERASGTSSV